MSYNTQELATSYNPVKFILSKFLNTDDVCSALKNSVCVKKWAVYNGMSEDRLYRVILDSFNDETKLIISNSIYWIVLKLGEDDIILTMNTCFNNK